MVNFQVLSLSDGRLAKSEVYLRERWASLHDLAVEISVIFVLSDRGHVSHRFDGFLVKHSQFSTAEIIVCVKCSAALVLLDL